MPQLVNHKLIDMLRKVEGWRELVKYYENELETARRSAESCSNERDAWTWICASRSLLSVLNFLNRKPDVVE